MLFCTNCGTQLNEGTKFCPGCGKAIASEQNYTAPQPAQIYAPAPTPVVVTAPAEVVVPTKSKVLGFVSMGLGIGSLIFAVISIFYTLMMSSLEAAAGVFFAFYFGAFSLPLSIVGMVLSGKSSSCGITTTPASVGKKLSVAGLVVSCVAMFISLIAVFAA